MLPIINHGRSRGIAALHPRQADALPAGSRVRWGLLFGLALGAAAGVQAADLGSLRVLSASGDPLRAEIDVTSLKPDEAASLKVALAPADVYRQVQLRHRASLDGLTLSLQDRPDGRKVVAISSGSGISEPVLDLLVELTWNAGRFIRQYSFVLDAPPATASAPMVDAPVAAPLQVAPGDTLFSLATRIRPPGASIYQTLAALLRANPGAFINGNMNLLRAGAQLTMPTARQITAIDTADANRLFASQAAAFSTYRDRLATAAGAAPRADGGVPGPQSEGSIAATPRSGDEPQAATGDELKLSSRNAGSPEARSEQAVRDQLQEERDANAKALVEAESRVRELQHDVNAMRGLLDAQNRTLAGMEQGAQANAPAEPAPAVPATPPSDPAAADTQAAAPVDPAAPAATPETAPPAAAPETTPPAAVADTPAASPAGWLERVRNHALLVPAAVFALLALILGFFAWRRRTDERRLDSDLAPESPRGDPQQESVEATEAQDGFIRDWGPIAAFPAADPERGPRQVFNEEDFSEYDDAPAAGKPVLPAASANFGFSLDLDAAAPASSSPPGERAGLDLDTDIDAPDIAAKLATAQAYLELGDRTGARELFNEVLRDGDVAQRLKARKALDALQ